jgi:hypothetical protein
MGPRLFRLLTIVGLIGAPTADALPLSQADLVVESLSVGTALPRAGVEVEVIYVVANIGLSESTGTRVCVGLAKPTGEQVFVEPGGVFLPPVAAGTRIDDRRSVVLPRVPAGLYRLFALADCGGELPESDETNNRLETGIIVGSAPLIIVTSEMPVAIIGRDYCEGFSPRLEASGGKPPYRWKLPLDRLPPGLRLAEDGLICGVPEVLGAYRFVAVVSDAAFEDSAPAQIAIEVVPDSAHLDRFTLPEGTVFEPYRFTFTARGGQGPRSFGAEGELPPGLSLSAEGVLEGEPTASGTFAFLVTVVDQDGARDQRSAELVIVDRPTPKLLETAEAIGCACSSTGSGSGLWGLVMALAAMRPYRLARRLRRSPRARPPARE